MRWGQLVCAAALALSLMGCHEDGAVDEFGRLVDDYCACADEACREDVRARVAAFDKRRLEGDRYTDMNEIAGKAHRCADRDVPVRGAYSKPRR